MIEHYAIVDRDSTPDRIVMWIWSKDPIKPGYSFNRDGYKGTIIESEHIKTQKDTPIYCVTLIPSGYSC